MIFNVARRREMRNIGERAYRASRARDLRFLALAILGAGAEREGKIINFRNVAAYPDRRASITGPISISEQQSLKGR